MKIINADVYKRQLYNPGQVIDFRYLRCSITFGQDWFIADKLAKLYRSVVGL